MASTLNLMPWRAVIFENTCSPLLTEAQQHLSMRFLTVCVSSLEKCLPQPLACCPVVLSCHCLAGAPCLPPSR